MVCIITLEFPSQMHIDDIKVSKSLSKEKGLFWPIKNGFGIGNHPVPILNHAHAIGQISRIGHASLFRVSLLLASVHGRDGRFSTVVSWSTRGTWHRVVTLNESLCTPALPRTDRACHVQVSDETAPVTCRRRCSRRSGMSPFVITREPSKTHNLRVNWTLKQQSGFRIAIMLKCFPDLKALNTISLRVNNRKHAF